MEALPFKRITRENWLEPDPVNAYFVGTPEQFLNAILAPQLNPTVPEEVLGLFEIARSTMSYGYLFYPFYTVAWEQLFRVGEAAINHRCKAMQAPKSAKTFDAKVNWLIAKGELTDAEGQWWHRVRQARNFVSHQERQSLAPAGPAITQLESMGLYINDLFSLPLATPNTPTFEEYGVGTYVCVIPTHPHVTRYGRVGQVTSVAGYDYLVQECRPDDEDSMRYWVNRADVKRATMEECCIQVQLDVMKR